MYAIDIIQTSVCYINIFPLSLPELLFRTLWSALEHHQRPCSVLYSHTVLYRVDVSVYLVPYWWTLVVSILLLQ